MASVASSRQGKPPFFLWLVTQGAATCFTPRGDTVTCSRPLDSRKPGPGHKPLNFCGVNLLPLICICLPNAFKKHSSLRPNQPAVTGTADQRDARWVVRDGGGVSADYTVAESRGLTGKAAVESKLLRGVLENRGREKRVGQMEYSMRVPRGAVRSGSILHRQQQRQWESPPTPCSLLQHAVILQGPSTSARTDGRAKRGCAGSHLPCNP